MPILQVKTSLIVACCLLTVPLAGCFGTEPEARPVERNEPEPAGPGERLLPYEVDPSSANASELDGAHTHDAWGDLDQLVLFEGNADTERCGSATGNVLDAYAGVRDDQQVQSGCAHWRFADGVIVPEGTERLVIEIDATEALEQGGVQLWYGNSHRTMAPFGDSDDDGEAAWDIPMAAKEWDVAHAGETTWVFELRPSGSVAVLDGTVSILSVAHKLPDWVPRLGSAHIDHWDPASGHTFPVPDVMLILDTTVDLTQPSYAQRSSGAGASTVVPLDDIIPPDGTMAVAAVLRYDDGIAGCPAAHECWVEPRLNPIGSRVTYTPELVQGSPTHGVFLWDVPEPIVPDSTYVTESGYQLLLAIHGCPNGEEPPGSSKFDLCQASLATELTADVGVLMEAYRGAFDANGIRSRAGV